MIILTILTGIGVIGYGLLYAIIPKGWIAHEIMDLPFFWFRHSLVPLRPMRSEKIQYGNHRHQYLLFFRPPVGRPEKNRLIIYFHGGSWRIGQPSFFKANANFFTEMGYPVAIVSHRKPPKFKYTDLKEDLIQMLTAMEDKMAESFGEQPYDMVVGGMSSGGHLAAMVIHDSDVLSSTSYSISAFKGLFLCGTPLNFNLLKDSFVLRDLAGPRMGKLFQEANPLYQFKAERKVPIFCIHGEKDAIVPLVSIQPFLTEVRDAHIPLDYEVVPKGNHISSMRWLYRDGSERELFLNWLEGIDNHALPKKSTSNHLPQLVNNRS